MISAVVIVGLASLAWQLRPEPEMQSIDRDPFLLFPRQIGEWESSPTIPLTPSVEAALGADDYHSVELKAAGAAAPVGLFMAWYDDQSDGGTHSPEVCLPGAGWEIAWIERVDIGAELSLDEPYYINRAIIQKGEQRMMAYYWFEQHGRHIAWDYAAKFWLLWDGITIGRTDGALVRLLTPITGDESEAQAEERLSDVFLDTIEILPSYIPSGDLQDG